MHGREFHAVTAECVLANLKIQMKLVVHATPIESFHVTSYQANFESHHTRDSHVGFLLTQSGIGQYNKMSRYFLISSYHNTKL